MVICLDVHKFWTLRFSSYQGENIETPKVHADVPGRGERLRGPTLFLCTFPYLLCKNFQFLIWCQRLAAVTTRDA